MMADDEVFPGVPWDADDDDTSDIDVQGSGVQYKQWRRVHLTPIFIDLIDGDEDAAERKAEDQLENELQEVIDLTDETPCGNGSAIRIRKEGERSLDRLSYGGFNFKPGTVVELRSPIPEHFRSQFVKIAEIVATAEGTVLRGFPYTRVRNLEGKLARKRNEICRIEKVNNSDPQPKPWTVDVSPGDIVRVRELRTTNSAFPRYQYDANDRKNGLDWVTANGPLVCRYTYVEHFADLSNKNARPREWAIVRVSEHEADAAFRESAEAILNKWRGGKVSGGSFTPNGRNALFVDLDLDGDAAGSSRRQGQKAQVKLAPGQRYSAGDTFSGAGGACRGISQAGAQLEFTVDNWNHAVASIKLNFPTANNYDMDIHKFILSNDIQHRVDMLHLSPPCQVWSPAHTVAGQNDERNEAALYSCGDLIKKTRPRVFTLEQTFGILHGRFEEYFNKLTESFVCHGYSIRWKVVNLATYGLPQPRKRLLIIGAGPGESPPLFPAPTHSENGIGGLKPFVTAYQAVAPALKGQHRNNPLNVRKELRQRQTPWDPHRTLPRTITCSGGQNYHWDGKRDFTLLEYALLQGFPPNHLFSPACVKKQIGNAFPPSVVRVLYDHLISWLDKHDNVDGSTRVKLASYAVPGEDAKQPLIISDGEDIPEITRVVRKPPAVISSGSEDSPNASDDESFCTGDDDLKILNWNKKRPRSEERPTASKRAQTKSTVAINIDSDTDSDEPANSSRNAPLPTRPKRRAVSLGFPRWTPSFYRRTPQRRDRAISLDDEDEPFFSDAETGTVAGSSLEPDSPRTPSPFWFRAPPPTVIAKTLKKDFEKGTGSEVDPMIVE